MNADKIRAGLWGVLVADALGVPHEFKHASHIPPSIDMVMPADYPKTFRTTPYGTWSDDGSLTLALTDSLATCGKYEADDFGARMIAWFSNGAYSPTGKSFDVGNTTMEAILRIMRGHPAVLAGLDTEDTNGNGSLMRVLPVALFHKGSDEDLFCTAAASSQVTHAHAWSRAACGIYCVAARQIANGIAATPAFLEGFNQAVKAGVKLPALPNPAGSGFVLDTLSFAISAARSGCTYEEGVLQAIRLGRDTDTTAAVVGGLLAARDGMSAIPSRWLDALRGRDMAEDIIERFVSVCCGS